MSPNDLQEAAQAAETARHQDNMSDRVRASVGLGFIAVGIAATGVLISGSLDDERFSHAVPYNETAQEVVNNVDDILGMAGAIALPGSLLAIGVLKLGSRGNASLRALDRRSSQELSDDGHSRPGLVRRGLRTVAAGSLPVVVGASAAVGALTAGIGTEITEGPNRPIVALDRVAPGNVMITQYDTAMPMLDSKLSTGLTNKIVKVATQHGVQATPFSIGLHSLQFGDQARTALTLGLPPANLPPALEATSCYEPVPVSVDTAAGVSIGDRLRINGVSAVVADTMSGTSATNRIGMLLDQRALEQCFNKNYKREGQAHAVVLDTDAATAHDILDEANAKLYDGPNDIPEVATVITKERYAQNSEDFWESNVKPITNTLALVGLMTSFIAMGGSAVSRMLRNRRELAAKLAAGDSVNRFRATELFRAAKDGVLGSSIGVVVAAGLTVPVNALESGMRAGLGVHEAMVGYAVGILGTMGGTLMHVIRPHKVVDPSEHTRI